MNIIKLKDKIMPSDLPNAEYFNKYLKGKYAYWIQMRYIVSFEHMRHEGYVACEEDINKLLQREDGTWPRPYGAPSLDVYEPYMIEYVDSLETDRINNTIDFRMKNKYVSDEDITIDELKIFRTWLAQELLKMDQTELGEQKQTYFDESELQILKYYSNNMYDDVIRILTIFGNVTPTISPINKSSCSCHNSSDLSSLYNQTLNFCEPVSIYRKNIYQKMVEMFSQIGFWTHWTPEFIGIFKKYIDNIINLNLPLTQSEWTNEFIDCTCKDINQQNQAIDILKRLSKSLEYIKTNDYNGHKNYIKDALYEWSSSLYENMNWE